MKSSATVPRRLIPFFDTVYRGNGSTARCYLQPISSPNDRPFPSKDIFYRSSLISHLLAPRSRVRGSRYGWRRVKDSKGYFLPVSPFSPRSRVRAFRLKRREQRLARSTDTFRYSRLGGFGEPSRDANQRASPHDLFREAMHARGVRARDDPTRFRARDGVTRSVVRARRDRAIARNSPRVGNARAHARARRGGRVPFINDVFDSWRSVTNSHRKRTGRLGFVVGFRSKKRAR